VLIEEGRIHYLRNCLGCHGASVVSVGVLPDLRYAPILASEDSWRAVVIDGILTDKGMLSFAENLSPAEAEALRSYIVSRAHASLQPRLVADL
jgi:mono/diheme cytochrome c family protein